MISAMPKIAGESSFARFGSENRSLRLSCSSITVRRNTTMKPPSIGPITVAAPPITTATRNSIEIWNVSTLRASASRVTSTESEPAVPGVERAERERRRP